MLGKRPSKTDESTPSSKRQSVDKDAAKRCPFLDNLTALIEHYSTILPNAFKERIFVAYKNRILNDLYNALCLVDEDEFLSKIKAVLAKNAQFIKGNALCYTALPEDDATLLLCDIATWLQSCTKEPALTLLLPGVATESFDEKDYVDLTKLPLKEVLRTHLISKCENYLFPVSALRKIELETRFNERIYNPYYNLDKKGEAYCDHQRLYEHSATAKALHEAKLDYHQLLKEDDSLYSQLIKLINSLYINGVSGMGREHDAAGGAYPAIIRFHEYYAMLNEEQKKQIPDSLKEEIEKLIHLSSDSTVNICATESIQTCIDSRQKALKAAMQGNTKQLMEIDLGTETKQVLINAQRSKFRQCHEVLQNALIECKYSGVDKLPLTMALLTELRIHPQVSSMAEVNDLMSLSPNELVELLDKQHSLPTQIAKQFTAIDTLVIFLIEQSPEHLQVVLPKIKDGLCNHQIFNTENMVACLIALEGEKLKVVSQALMASSDLQTRVTAKSFWKILKYLSPSQRSEFYQAVKGRLSEMVMTAMNLSDVLRHLTAEQCKEVCQSLKEKLPTIIAVVWDFRTSIYFLTLEQRAKVYQAVKERVLILIHVPEDFQNVLELLTLEQRAEVYEAVKARLPKMIETAKNFQNVLEFLSLEQRAEVYEAVKERLPKMIKTPENFQNILEFLCLEHRSEIYQSVNENLQNSIKNARELRCMLTYLTPEQCVEVCRSLNEIFPKIIKTSEDVKDICKSLTPEQGKEICQTLIEIIQTARMFSYTLMCLSRKCRTEVYDAVKGGGVFSRIKTRDDFWRVLVPLTPEQCAEVCQNLTKDLPQIIQTIEDLIEVFSNLAPDQCTKVYDAVKERLLTAIKEKVELAGVLAFLPPECCVEVCRDLNKTLPEIIKTLEDLVSVFNYLTPEKCEKICQSVPDWLLKIIQTAQAFSYVLGYLTPDRCTEVYDAVKQKLFSTIKTREDCWRILRHLTVEQRLEVVISIKERLATILGGETKINSFLAQYHIKWPVHAPDDMKVDSPNVLLISDASRQNDRKNPSKENRENALDENTIATDMKRLRL